MRGPVCASVAFVARMYPKTMPDSAAESEKRVYSALKTLGADWVVVYGLSFVVPARRNRSAINGEADFVLMHPKQGLIVLEAKGGKYLVVESEWYTFPGGKATRMSRSPFLQAKQNRYALTDYIASAGGPRGVPAGHAVIFTDGAPSGGLGPEAPGAITLDARDLAEPSTTVGRLCEHWFAGPTRGMSQSDFEAVVSLLAPDASVAAEAKYRVDVAMIDIRAHTERQVRFTDEQLAVIEATTGTRFVTVLGAAGTGKTLIAARRAEKLASEGLKVLFLADQRYLHSTLRGMERLKSKQIVLGTPEEVLDTLEPPGADPGSKPLWERFLAVHEAGVIFDVVIVDEAQSFDDDVLDALGVLSQGSCHFFADPYQRDSEGMWRPPGAPETLWLTQNCRNSLPIAKLVARLGGALTPTAGPLGSVPCFTQISSNQQGAMSQVIDATRRLLRDFPAEDVAVLTCTSDVGPVAKALRSAGILVATRPGRQGVTLAAASEFRGCEAPVVLLLAGPGSDCPPAAVATNHYIATSRAVAHLEVLGLPDEWSDVRFIMESR